MPSRRSFLRGVSAAALAVPALGGLAASPALAVPPLAGRRAPEVPLPLTIVNSSGQFDNASIHVYVVGTNLDTGEQSRVTPEGQLVPVSESDNGSDGFADYAIPLQGSGDTQLNLPSMSGRIYFALGEKLKFKVVVGGDGKPALQYPAGWVDTDPNYGVLHDTVEFTLKADGMYCNTTMVDMFSVPLSIQLRGAADQTTGTVPAGGRDRILSGVAGHPDFAGLRQDDLRVIAPGHGLDLGKFSGTYYDSYIDEVWSKYQGTQLRIDTDNGKVFTGQVSGDTFNFDGGVKPIGKPSTRDVLFCDGALAAPNDGITGPVAAILGAGFNRSILLDSADQPGTDPAGFYRHDITNHYSKVMHENTEDGKAYGFAFDDVAGFASYVQDNAPTSITVTLTPW
ncbi:beta-1,3-glucanase family protein [Saccharopolyspora indica]|uniref:beta-1,3-glucanase family protein n=1 Tax=Saccharopolyspora indica TaxID=1229659 RepID=UPI0022EA9EF9|nr:beta-1,3-glucanase family protein [Saccharopolyspora indica]MDA3650158.1 beta-1,3-glucanase family protein [Saccharopolyspora indica]